MKAQNKIVTAILILFTSSIASAAVTEKPATRINFNKMIDESKLEKIAAETKLNDKLDQVPEAPAPTAKSRDKSKVIKFVDVEVGVGKERPVVDRRVNSLEDPVIKN